MWIADFGAKLAAADTAHFDAQSPSVAALKTVETNAITSRDWADPAEIAAAEATLAKEGL